MPRTKRRSYVDRCAHECPCGARFSHRQGQPCPAVCMSCWMRAWKTAAPRNPVVLRGARARIVTRYTGRKRTFTRPRVYRENPDNPVVLRGARAQIVTRYTGRKRTFTRPRVYRENPAQSVEVYRNVRSIVATKGPGHRCDAACRRARHTYIHRFRAGARILGRPDGSLVIESQR